ncbi:uncharacterized protein JKF63_07959 [Porcisia hertigi]|uniref:Uncharacterized protein n=1 Tax=Porcisia hertigi TaxID=2761500 RepID=A0A836HBH0_9TRYP|nr:hypothetical protein JKF63_07959 [Porcisia hertigi]
MSQKKRQTKRQSEDFQRNDVEGRSSVYALPQRVPAAPNEASILLTEDDLRRDFESEISEVTHDKSLSRRQRAERKRELLKLQVLVESERERRAIAALEAKLPRPQWYSSDDDDDDDESVLSDVERAAISELKKQPEGGAGLVFRVLYTVLSAVAFVFHLTSTCPIPWLRSKSGRTYGVWSATGGGQPDLKVRDIHDCSYEMQYWQAAAAMSVLATIVSCAATIGGVLLCVNQGHMALSFIFSFYSVVFSLTSWALVVALSHHFRCGKGVFANGVANLDAGFALTLCGWVMHMAAIIVLGLHFFKYWTRSIHKGNAHALRFIYVAVGIVTLLFYSVGQAYAMWGKTFPDVKVSISMWHVQVHDRQTRLSTFLSRGSYRCTTITHRMKVVAAFMIMSIIWLFFAVVLGTGACYNSYYIKHSLFFGYSSSIFALVAWITLLVTRYSRLCTGATPYGQSYWTDMGYNGIPSGIDNAQIDFDGYTFREGFGLIVAGWAISLLATVLNTVL